MDTIRRRILSAQRRLMLQRFGRAATWSLFAMLIVALLGSVVPKIWAVQFPGFLDLPNPAVWAIGAVILAIIIAGIVTFLRRPSLTDAAIEVDRRFGLRERMSSSLSLDETTSQTEMGRALLRDAELRAEHLAISERFELRPQRRGLLPLIPAVFLVLIIFIPDATRENKADAGMDRVDQKELQQIKTVAEQLKKQLQQQARKAATEGLEEAENLFKQLERKTDEITKLKDSSKKEALVALNDIKKQLEERRNQLGSPDEMRKALSKLDDMEKGPADKVTKALEKGDFGDAQEQVKELAKKLEDGSLTEEEKKQLTEQVKQLADQLNKAVQKQEQAKRELQEKIEQAKREGRTEEAAKMQQKMNELQQMDGQMQQLKDMAQKLDAAKQAMDAGNSQEAADAMKEMADQLGDMADEMAQLEEFEDVMGQLQEAKDKMSCKECGGAGCQACQGNGEGDKPGDGLGKGQGEGDRPEQEEDTSSYESQVRGKPKAGRAVIAGTAGGENKKGVTRESVQEAVRAAMVEEGDPIEDQVLPRKEREHAQQYFDRLRDGN